MGIALLSLIILTGCATDQTPPPVAATPSPRTDQSVPARPLACSDFPPLKFNNGQPDITVAMLTAIMAAHPDNPLGWARGALGDTISTRQAISDYAAARHALGCE